MKVQAKVSSADGSYLGPIGTVVYMVILGACEFDNKLVVCKYLLCQVILGLDFAQNFRVQIDWNNQGHLYLHQDHIPLIYSIQANPKNSAIYSADCNKTRLISVSSELLSSQTIPDFPEKVPVLQVQNHIN